MLQQTTTADVSGGFMFVGNKKEVNTINKIQKNMAIFI